MEVTVGIEPTNNGFANRAISHSGTSPQGLKRPLEFNKFGRGCQNHYS